MTNLSKSASPSNKKYFLDTEFIEAGPYLPITVLSIGIVCEDGRELYLEADADISHANEWVRVNVFPHLVGPKLKLDAIAARIRSFVGLGTEIEFWGYYADYDWVVFAQIFGSMMDLPNGWPMYCRDIKQLCDSRGNPKLPEQSSTEHNALNDARWNLEAYKFLESASPSEPRLEFLGSLPDGTCEWRCTKCKIAFSLKWDEENTAIQRDPWNCPYCGVAAEPRRDERQAFEGLQNKLCRRYADQLDKVDTHYWQWFRDALKETWQAARASAAPLPQTFKEKTMKAENIVRLIKPGTEWLVELHAPDTDGSGEMVCGLFASKDVMEADHFYKLACRIIDTLASLPQPGAASEGE